MKRVMSLYLPNWSTDRLRKSGDYRPDLPLVTAYQEGSRRLIAQVDPCARQLGLRPGLSTTYAQATTPNLQLAEADPVADAAALLRLAQWCLRRYSPLVALDEPDGLWLDLTGCAHRFGGESGLIDDLLAHCAKAGFGAIAALADVPGTAHAVARYSQQAKIIVPSGQEKTVLADFPISALRLPATIVSALCELGIARIQQLYEMPRAPLARRFGITLMRRYDQVLGIEAEPLCPIELPETPQVVHVLAEPANNQDYLRWLTGNMCAELCRMVEAKSCGIRHLDVRAERVDGRQMALRIGTARPTRDAKHLAKMLSEKIPEIDVGFGIERLWLIASLIEPFDHQQQATDFGAPQNADIAGLIDIITNRIGPAQVCRMQAVESDVPERSSKPVAALASAAGTWPRDLPRPSLLLRQPESIQALSMLPDYPPKQFVWRRDRYRVVRADGPERIYGEWWQRTEEVRTVRDYFRVEDEKGRRFWIFRRGDGADPHSGSHEWFLHGLFA